MGVGIGNGDVSPVAIEDSIIGETLEVRDGHLYFNSRRARHPIRVMATTRIIRVGCVSISREAWELLKRKIDGVPS